MSRLKIRNDAQEDTTSKFYTGQPFASYGTEVFLDGQKLKSCRSVDLRVSIDEVVSAKVDVLATDSLDVEIDASVVLSVTAFDEFDLEETPLANGGRRLRAVRR